MMNFSEYMAYINESNIKELEKIKTELESKIENSDGEERQKLLSRINDIDAKIRSSLNIK
jgi:hypothetical protein